MPKAGLHRFGAWKRRLAVGSCLTKQMSLVSFYEKRRVWLRETELGEVRYLCGPAAFRHLIHI